MSAITTETRKEAFHMRPAKTRKNDILNVLGDREMSARQIAWRLGYEDLNMVRPRITEMCEEGLLEATGTIRDTVTGRRVAKFRKIDWEAAK